MTVKKLISYLTKKIENKFEIDDNRSEDYSFLLDNQIIILGEDHTEVFIITIDKV